MAYESTSSPTNSSISSNAPSRLNSTSSRRNNHVSTATTTPTPSRASSKHEPVQSPRPILHRPSNSAPKLTMKTELSSPPSSPVILSPPLSPRPESASIHQVLETHRLSRNHNIITGNPCINKYEMLGDIGSGVHGKVKKAKDLETGTIVAIKIVNRETKKRLGNYDPNEQEKKIKREIAIMKKCHHPNIVNLIEVIDDPKSRKVYLVLEYVERGEIKWRDRNNRPLLTVSQIRPMIRDVILGLDYLHFQGIIHRDIKPGNLLLSSTGVVKISDFGVSHLSKIDEAGNPLPENDLDLAKTAGSPAFFAPELCRWDPDKPRQQITGQIDVWALGITFYCLLFGREPFPQVNTEMELYDKILNCEIEPPEEYKGKIDADGLDLLHRFLIKDPEKRITLYEARRHPFITKDLTNPSEWAEQTDLKQPTLVQVTPEEVGLAVTSLWAMVRRKLTQVKMTAKKSMSYLRSKNGRMSNGPVTAPSSPPLYTSSSSLSNAGVYASCSPPVITSPKAENGIPEQRPKHAYFHSSAVKSGNAAIPPTPPHSGRVGTSLPPAENGKVNGGPRITTDVDVGGGVEKPLTPPLQPIETHLNDDYSNLYYDDVGFDSDLDDQDESDDDEEDRLEMGSRRRQPASRAAELQV